MQKASFIVLYIASFLILLALPLYAQDFSLELMKCRASLDRVIVDAGPKYHKIKAQADAISDAIEKLRQEIQDSRLKIEDSENQKSSNLKSLNLQSLIEESRFRRKITCVHISIKALGAEVKKYFCMGTAI